MINALDERGFNVDHSETWKRFHNEGIFEEIDAYVKQQLMLK
jgi:hypothetical protein